MTMRIEVLGRGCRKCDELYENVREAVKQAGIAGETDVVKIQDEGYFLKHGVFTTPGLIIDGRVVSTGRLLTTPQVSDLILNADKA